MCFPKFNVEDYDMIAPDIEPGIYIPTEDWGDDHYRLVELAQTEERMSRICNAFPNRTREEVIGKLLSIFCPDLVDILIDGDTRIESLN